MFYAIWTIIAWILGKILSLFSREYRNVWLISERGMDARDNAYHLFYYIRKRYPNINIYYVIERTSPDFKRVNAIGKIVERGSIKHYFLFAIAKYKISTHILGYSPNITIYDFLDKHFKFVRGKKILLQHGITKDILPQLMYPKVRLDLFITGAFPEYNFIKDNFNHPKGVVQYLGFCRFDALKRSVRRKKQILFMPTWRMYISGMSGQEFIKSEYYKKISGFLNNKRLEEILERNGYKMVFYPHHEIQPYLSAFQILSKYIEFNSEQNCDLQTLMLESECLITDYSSVAFDFAYMKKNCIYYQFDQKLYRSGHYGEGYFDYEKDGFGPVVRTEEKLLEELEILINSGEGMKKRYLSHRDDYFRLDDDQNCERVLRYIMKYV